MADMKWAYVVESRGNISAYAADSKETAMLSAKAYADHLTASEHKQAIIQVCGFNIEEAAQEEVDDGLYDTLEEAMQAFIGKNDEEIDNPISVADEIYKI